MKTLFTYTGRGVQKTQTVAPGGGSAEALTSQTYDLEGKIATSTDASGNVWTNDYSDDCCGHFSGRIDPLGHGSMTNMDAMGRAVHSATVKDYTTHTLKSDPDNAKTLAESTTRYDLLGRTRAMTTWLTPLGPIVKENPQIAGYDGVPLANGLTSQVYYDVNLKDGIGLDGTGGLTITKMTGSAPGETFTITSAQFAAVMNKLAEPIASGGAGLTFTSNESAPSAVISVNAEDDVAVSISDGMGRGVMTAQIQPWDGPQPFTLVTWSCQKHDTIYNLAGVGNVLESISIDANGKTVKSHTDGAGRTLQTVDQLGKISTSTFDAAGNVLSVRDPNGVGYDAVYDQLGRLTSQTDTFGDMTSRTYDKEGNVKSSTDAKGKMTTMVYDAQNRLKTTTDRLGGVTTNNFNCCRLVSIVDAEGQMTSYEYNTRGEKIKETYPDHVSNSAVGTSGYGIVEFLFDEAGRLKRTTDQAGDTCTSNYDLAGRMLQKDYRTLANSPSGTIVDSDIFTFDKASRMLTAVSGRYSNTVTNVFDPLGRHQQEKLTIAGQTYTITHDFDSLGRPFKMTYPDGTVTEKTFTDRGQLYQTKYAGSIIDTRTYDDGGRLSTSTYSNGAVTTHNYRVSGSNKDNLLASIVTTNPGTNKVGTYAYTWDPNKNKTAEMITNSPLSGYGFSTGAAGYDDENRVTAWNRSDNNQSQSWSLSLVGDWNTFNQTGSSPLTQTRTHGPTHEFTSFTGTNSGTITYDVKGNMTSRPASLAAPALSLVWDFDNKLKGADTDNTPATLEVTYTYDALGRRVSRTESGSTVIYLQSGQQTIADYAGGAAPSSPTYRYIYGSYIDEPLLRETVSSSIKHFYHRNQQYSVIAATNNTGDVVERFGFTAYGAISIFDSFGTPMATSSLLIRHTYTGREWDSPISMFFFRGRWFEPMLGRFANRDPLGYTDGFSLYTSSIGLKFLDPLGLRQEEDTFIMSSSPDIDGLGYIFSSSFTHNNITVKFDDKEVYSGPMVAESRIYVDFNKLRQNEGDGKVRIKYDNCEHVYDYSVSQKDFKKKTGTIQVPLGAGGGLINVQLYTVQGAYLRYSSKKDPQNGIWWNPRTGKWISELNVNFDVIHNKNKGDVGMVATQKSSPFGLDNADSRGEWFKRRIEKIGAGGSGKTDEKGFAFSFQYLATEEKWFSIDREADFRFRVATTKGIDDDGKQGVVPFLPLWDSVVKLPGVPLEPKTYKPLNDPNGK